MVLPAYRRVLVAAFTSVALVVSVSAPVAAATPPVPMPADPRGLRPPVKQPRAVEAAASYQGQVSCNPVLMPGVRKLRDLALRTYQRGYDGGTTRSCVSGGTSEHKEGRAWDWMLDVKDRRERRAAADFLAWLTAPGRDGQPGVMARRLGVMYVIYNRKMWRAYSDDGWHEYSGYSPHTDHIHVSFSWTGAWGQTSFWTGDVAPVDYGPCAVFNNQPAPIASRPNPQPCTDEVALVRRSSRKLRFLGGAAEAVRVAEKRLGRPVDGSFDSSLWQAVQRYQRRNDLPVTGALDKPTWAALDRSSITSTVWEGRGPRSAARYAAKQWGDLVLHRRSAGAPVAFLQVALRLPARLRTGYFGGRTARAVRQFKQANGLPHHNARVTRAMWQELGG